MLRLSSSPNSICELEVFIQNLSKKYKICQERYPDILISLTEAVNNAIVHGNQENHIKEVVVEHTYNEKGLTFVVSDEGNGFDSKTIPDPTRLENLEKLGGRGVFLMRQLADRLKFTNNGRSVVIFFNV
jgi:serine/threonine-protein kinase RsbW